MGERISTGSSGEPPEVFVRRIGSLFDELSFESVNWHLAISTSVIGLQDLYSVLRGLGVRELMTIRHVSGQAHEETVPIDEALSLRGVALVARTDVLTLTMNERDYGMYIHFDAKDKVQLLRGWRLLQDVLPADGL